jgi:hypothetical protein
MGILIIILCALKPLALAGECGNWAMACPEVVNDFCSLHTNNLKGISSF